MAPLTKITYASGMLIKLIFLSSSVLGAPSVRDDSPYLNTTDEAERLINCKTSKDYSNLSDFQFSPRSVSSDDATCLGLRMFKEMGFVEQFHIPLDKLSRFILKVRKGYRKVPYHNWGHGFAVLHFSFAVLKTCKYIENNRLTPLEGLALLTAAMSHDLDHPGTNSKYQEETNSPMAQKYKEQGSILERHHIETTFNILRNPESNFIAQVTESEHRQFMDLVQQIILATDLVKHFKVLKQEQEMAMEGYDEMNGQHRYLLLSTVISSADLSDQTKDWTTARRVAKLINTEFFDQGDKEKAMSLVPLKMMDRNQANIAEEQAKFISDVVEPLFRVLETISPQARGCTAGLEYNHRRWQRAIPHFTEQSKKGRDQLDIIDDAALDQICDNDWKE